MSDEESTVTVPGSSQVLLPNSRKVADVDPDVGGGLSLANLDHFPLKLISRAELLQFG